MILVKEAFGQGVFTSQLTLQRLSRSDDFSRVLKLVLLSLLCIQYYCSTQSAASTIRAVSATRTLCFVKLSDVLLLHEPGNKPDALVRGTRPKTNMGIISNKLFMSPHHPRRCIWNHMQVHRRLRRKVCRHKIRHRALDDEEATDS